ncbi:MAG: GntG family PLP-dependent aldolase [Candidatus Latescibacterota bacterium]|jgi:threonine aldolase
MPKQIDLRSDTVTRPVPGMRDAIYNAEVGDDVFGDDPTVIALEKKVAAMYGAEASLYVASGTMANLIALSSLTSPGDEIVLDRQCHVFNYEVASVAALAGVQTNALDGDRGVITAKQIAPHIREANLHLPTTKVIEIENTHNRAGGGIFPFDEMKAIRELADERGVFVHLDGARLANAHVETGVPFADYYRCVDTLSMCFSKGLGAPVGSIVVSTAERIARARKIRKRLGGGMRQAGILAAAAIYALDNHVERLREDHANARRLAAFIENTEGLTIHQPVETNIVIFRVDESAFTVDQFLGRIAEAGVLAVPFGTGLVRMVTHLDVSADDIDKVGQALAALKRN